MADKVSELFNSREIDFEEDKDFSRFYVLTNDETKARPLLNEALRSFIKENDPDFVYKIRKHQLLFGSRRALSLAEVKLAADMTHAISRL